MDIPFNPTQIVNDINSMASESVKNSSVFAKYQAEREAKESAFFVYEAIKKSILEFQSSLDGAHEIGVQLASFNQNLLMYVTRIDYSAPTLIDFYGVINGKDARLIQHVSQLNFLLIAAPKLDANAPARRIGFEVSQVQ